MKRLRKWYAKRRMKAYMIDMWEEEARDAENWDTDHYEVAIQSIKDIRANNDFEEIVTQFSDLIGDINSRGYEGARDVVWVLIER